MIRALLTLAAGAAIAWGQSSPRIEIWHGAEQKVGHLGTAQEDFNLLGRVEHPAQLDRLTYSVNGKPSVPLSFRAFRRLVADGDFNADIPIGLLKPGANEIRVEARYRDGSAASRLVTVRRLSGEQPLPAAIRWDRVRDPQDVGQYVDGKWMLEPGGLRTAQVGYDRVFLIGETSWQDYDVRTSIRLHAVESPTPPASGGNGVGIICRFTGHVAGGPMHFPSGQPKWGYQPFGAIGWLRWADAARAPVRQFFRGDSNRKADHGEFPIAAGETFEMRMRVETLPDAPGGAGVTRYRFKAWKVGAAEPAAWDWEEVQSSAIALRRGGVALLAHHVDVTFGDITIEPVRQ